MTSMEEKGISSDRVINASKVNVDDLECGICHDLLWKPIACQSCETPFCSSCINRWIIDNPNKCANRCETYVERKCPSFIAKLLARLQISCYYQSKGCQQIIPYEALDKHEIECDYQPQQCSGCRLDMLKKEFDNHVKTCEFIELTCENCKLVYKGSDADTKHTKDICLTEQIRQLHHESKQNKQELQRLNSLWDKMRMLNPEFMKLTIKFDDLSSAADQVKFIPSIYRGLRWHQFWYIHKSYRASDHLESGYAACFTAAHGPHVAFFNSEASISVKNTNETFSFISIDVCAAWNDCLQLTIIGQRDSLEINIHKVRLGFGRPEHILLKWNNIDKIIFKSSDGIINTRNRALPDNTLIGITQIKIDFA